MGEHLAQVLGVEVGQRAGVHILAAVGVPLGVGVADPRHPELVELVVLAHAGEGDAVVDLADLVERPRRVLGHDGDPRVVDGGDQRPAPGDALLGVLGPVLHHLLGCHVVGHGHGWRPSDRRRSMRAANRSATSSSGTAVEPVGGDRGHQRVDPPDQVGTAGGGVLVGRLVEGLDGQLHGVVAGHAHPVAELDGGAGVASARAGGVVLGLLVVAAGHVVGEDAARAPGQVVAGEQRDHGQALHGHGQVLADHLAELVGLALEAEDHALDLLVVLELGLEQADHLHRRPGRAGDGHRRVAVGREDLLHGPVGDGVALGGPPVAGHHDAVGEPQGHHGGAVAELVAGARPAGRPGGAGPAIGRVQQAPAAGGSVRRSRDPGSSVVEKSGSVTGATRRPSGRSCGRTPRRCPRAPRRSRPAGRRARPSASRRWPRPAGTSSTTSSARSVVVVFFFCSRSAMSFSHPLSLSLAAQSVQQLGRARARVPAAPRRDRPCPSGGPS